MDTYAGLVENGLVVNVAVCDEQWANDNGYIFQTPQNCNYGNIAIGDSYNYETKQFVEQIYPPAPDNGA